MQQNLIFILIYGVLFGVFYFFWLAPRQKAQAAAKSARESLAPGDEVILEAGIHGFVADVEGDIAWVEVAEGVELKVSKSAIAAKLSNQDPFTKVD